MKNKPKFNVKPAPAAPAAAQAQQGRAPSIMIAVPAMEMVNAEFAQHLAMAAANLVANGIKINCAFNIGSVRNKPIVGVNYRRRRFPNANFTGMLGSNGQFREFETRDDSPPMELIDVLPHGCVLVHRSVYEKIPQPHYLQEYIPELNLEIGEDIYFCQQAQKAGYEVWCDQELSKEVSHIGIFHFNYNLSVPK